ncbi:hypothetical protein E3H47_04720 [Acinetobacter radioresistens]|uniref:hypothetical protein n=1 Tax=Acinetobacter radioresistens TaxID=40216 RepID=UPI0010CCE602|nr:hypothetical protein [Acinetobacter radioresistens]QCS11863.1 hypothetical protein E3H47_04720 [Acinetobacter radioresistens]
MTKHDNVSQGKIMKATEFVKRRGVSDARRILKDSEGCASVKLYGKYEFSTDDLKRLVESHEILGLFKSLDQAKADVAACEYAGHADLLVKLDCGIGYINTAKVKQAIADVEACQ